MAEGEGVGGLNQEVFHSVKLFSFKALQEV